MFEIIGFIAVLLGGGALIVWSVLASYVCLGFEGRIPWQILIPASIGVVVLYEAFTHSPFALVAK